MNDFMTWVWYMDRVAFAALLIAGFLVFLFFKLRAK